MYPTRGRCRAMRRVHTVVQECSECPWCSGEVQDPCHCCCDPSTCMTGLSNGFQDADRQLAQLP